MSTILGELDTVEATIKDCFEALAVLETGLGDFLIPRTPDPPNVADKLPHTGSRLRERIREIARSLADLRWKMKDLGSAVDSGQLAGSGVRCGGAGGYKP